MAQDTTFFGFYMNIRAFLSSLLKNPLKTDVSEYLKERGFTKKRVINLLIKKGVLTRKEKVNVASVEGEEPKAVYEVKYGVRKENFERNIRRIYMRYFEKNEPAKELNECNGADGISIETPLSNSDVIYRPSLLCNPTPKKKKKNNDIKENIKMKRTFKMTEEQVKEYVSWKSKQMDEATTTGSVGAGCTFASGGYEAPGFAASKNDKFWKDSLDHSRKPEIQK